AQFGQWMRIRVKMMWERGSGIVPAEAIARVSLLGSVTRIQILNDFTHSSEANTLALRLAMWDLYPAMDTRPEGSFWAGALAHSILADPMRRDRDYGSAVERAPRGRERSDRARFYERIGDVAKLREIAGSADANPNDRSRALQALSERDDVNDGFIRASYERLLREQHDSWVFSRYVAYLTDHHDWSAAERIARMMLARTPASDARFTAYYSANLADALERQGRYDEAWAVVEPHLASMRRDILTSATSLLERRGKGDEAEELGRKLIERYPDGVPRADFAAVLWRMGKFREAADLLDPKHQYAFSSL